ncbi:hypothetical protein K469DRAFT_550672, partial [Zopfia rhizophila CBS 207.26]
KIIISSSTVEFKDVNFSYSKENSVLKNINFITESSKTITFIVKTSSGKSTIIKLLFRFYNVIGGLIIINS